MLYWEKSKRKHMFELNETKKELVRNEFVMKMLYV